MEKYIKTSKITNRQFNLFNTVRIKNLKQAGMYVLNNVLPVDIEVERNDNGDPFVVWVFDRDESKVVYDLWCKHELR